MMTENTPTDPQTDAQAYQHLADRIRDADAEDVWNAFAKDMDHLAAPTENADGEYVGYVLAVSTARIGSDAPLRELIAVTHRQFGGTRDGLRENPVAENADVYAIRTQTVQNPTEVARRAVADALERAAE